MCEAGGTIGLDQSGTIILMDSTVFENSLFMQNDFQGHMGCYETFSRDKHLEC